MIKDESINRPRRLIGGLGAATVALFLVGSTAVQAGDHWLSRVIIKTPGQPDTVMTASQTASEGLASVLQATSSQAVFEITISLDSNPQGDDNYKVDSGASDDEQNAYEKRIEEFARAVYQSTNGAHKIGKVTIFREGESANSADVVWNETCAADQGPRANSSGFGVAGWHIWMCTNWPGASTLMPTAKGGGYTMAHEWGHYAFGLYDEYAQEQCDPADIAANTCWKGTPRATDTAAIPAIMNDQWFAASGTGPPGYAGSAADFLEHSTQNIHPHRRDSTGTNAQRRVFGESAWQTLTRDPATDPKFSWLPTRTQYTALTAPADPDWIVSDDESTALSELDIRWVGNPVMELSIDRSGSMSGDPISNAKAGANLLIDQIQPGTALGVSSFARKTNPPDQTDITRNFAITDIPDPDTGVKVSAKAAVNALPSVINIEHLTPLYDALTFSLSGVQTFAPNRPGLVFVLSDGENNASLSADEASVISAYQAAGVPIIALAYGNYAPTGTLFKMADETGGAFYQSPTTLAEIQAIFLAAEAQFSSNVLLSSAKAPAAASATTTLIIPMDSTLASARINLSYTGSQADFDFSLRLPDGTASGVPFVCEGAASCTATLDEAFFAASGYGDYQIQMVNKTGTAKDVTVLVSATPSGAKTYDIAVGFSSNTVHYPSNMALRATVTQGSAIAGLDVSAIVTGPMGITFNLMLLDDGKGADLFANDGTYSVSIPYAADGIYSVVVTASNADGNAQTTFEGISVSLREDGTAVMPTPTAITENFVRVGTASANVVGLMTDDHANDPTGGNCTGIFDDNADTPGRIDYAGDTDCFTVVPGSVSNPIIVRATSLTSGMDPVLTVYDHTGAIQIAQVNMSTSESPSSGVTVTVAAADLDPLGLVFVVQHIDPTATIGGYAVSAGTRLISDASPVVSSGWAAFAIVGDSALSIGAGSIVQAGTGEARIGSNNGPLSFGAQSAVLDDGNVQAIGGIMLSAGSAVSGTVVTNADFVLGAKGKIGQSAHAGGKATLQDGARVDGDLVTGSGSYLGIKASVGGSIIEGAIPPTLIVAPAITMPTCPVNAPGTAGDRKTKPNETVALAPADYGQVNFGARNTVSLCGDYSFRSLVFGPKTTVAITCPTTLQVKGLLVFGDGVKEELRGTVTAENVRYFAEGGMSVGAKAVVSGTVCAPQAGIAVGNGTSFTGALYGNEVRLGAQVNFVSSPAVLPQMCVVNDDCQAEEYCRKADGDCDGIGACELKPTICPLLWDPVCGCDRVTRPNRCVAAWAGVNVLHLGPCR